jgi:hypothetical protein
MPTFLPASFGNTSATATEFEFKGAGLRIDRAQLAGVHAYAPPGAANQQREQRSDLCALQRGRQNPLQRRWDRPSRDDPSFCSSRR